MSKTILDGMESHLGSAGIDLGESDMPLSEDLAEEKDLEQDVSNGIVSSEKVEKDHSNQNPSDQILANRENSDGDVAKESPSEEKKSKKDEPETENTKEQ